MCGIAAIIRSVPDAPANTPFPQPLRVGMDRALHRLSARGPDGRGQLAHPHGRWLLGHTRLAIQDLSTAAAQPMATPDGTLTLVYNGEIYNAPALRAELANLGRRFHSTSDTEVLLHALDAWGLRTTLDKIRGMYAFVAVRDEPPGTHVMAAVDAAGMKPLAWTILADPAHPYARTLYVASDCDALRELLPVPARLDPDALAHVLTTGYIPAPFTAWKDVHKLPPGAAMEWHTNHSTGPRVWTHWSPPGILPSPSPHPHDDAIFPDLLRTLPTEHLIGDVPIGLFLSAGLDSTSIALALADAKIDLSRISACTLSTGDAADESADAARTAIMLGLPHERVPFPSGELVATLHSAAARFDEPQGFTAILTATRIADAMRTHAPHAKVVLAGDGGDEALAGYAWHRDPPTHPLALTAFAAPSTAAIDEHAQLASAVAAPTASSRDRLAALHALGTLSFVHRSLVRTFGGFHPAEAAALFAPLGARCGEESFVSWLAPTDDPALPMPRRAQRLDLRAFCAGSIQPKLDRACMGAGLELRAPYLDRRMLDWSLSRPVDAAEHTPAGAKAPIRALLAHAIERGRLPRELLARPKQGFSLRTEPGAFDSLPALISSSRLTRDGALHPRWPEYLTADPESRRVRLFTLAMLAAWYEVRA